jgi:integrase
MTATFSSALAPTIHSYLTLKRALGRQYAMHERILAHLDRFLAARGADLGAETFAEWCLTFQHLASGNRRTHMREVRNACLYRRRRDPSCFVPDARLFPPVHQAVRPHLFTECQVGQLLAVARTRAHTDNSPLCPEMMRLAIVLLYTTGMRRRELTKLTVGDYDPREHTLMIRESKFHKSRLIPVSADAAREIDRLLDVRRRGRFPVGSESPLLWHRYRGYSGGGVSCTIRALFRQAAIRTASGGLPRIHDFRHAFAVTALLRWYRAGRDVQAKLPFLAHYMGHVSIVSTAYYLQFVEPLAAAASTRFAEACGPLITPSVSGGAR